MSFAMALILTAATWTAPDELVTKGPCIGNAPGYSAILNSEAPTGRFLDFGLETEAEIPAGWHLEDIVAGTVVGKRYMGGVLRQGDADVELVQGLGKTEFEALVAEKLADGSCLSGFDTWFEKGEQRFAGVFEGTCEGQILKTGLGIPAMAAELHAMSQSHRLVDFETVVRDGFSSFSAVWRSGPSETLYVVLAASWHTFHDQAHELNWSGYRLADFDLEKRKLPIWAAVSEYAAVPTDRVLFSAVWRRSRAEEWLGVDYHLTQFQCAAGNLATSWAKSGIDELGLCDAFEGEPADAKMPLNLVTVDLHPLVRSSCFAFHGGPLHDSGPAGPP